MANTRRLSQYSIARFTLTVIAALGLAALGLAATGWAALQENGAAAQEKAAQEKATEKKAGSEGTAEKADAAGGDFDAKYAEWKKLLTNLRKLRSEYESAEESETEKYQQQWDEMIAQGETLLGELRASGLAQYKKRPNIDRQLTRFLAKLLGDDIARDRYERALELGTVLVASDIDIDEVYSWAGTAAFSTHAFDKAEQFLDKAQAVGALNEDAIRIKSEIADYKKYWAEEQEVLKKEAAADDLPRVKLTTSKGDIIVELFENEAPGAVGNFISLVKKDFYTDLTFHRVLQGFMAQGGCPVGDGTGGPGYSIYDECKQENARKHFRGYLSMAKGPSPNSGGSQFFITFKPTPMLNGEHTVFGRVIEGMDIVAKLQRRDPETENPPEPDKILKAEVLRDRGHAYEPNKVK